MARDKVRIAFADAKMESDYKKLRDSVHPEDQKLHAVWTSVRRALAENWMRGEEITRRRLARFYIRLYRVDNVWRLEVPQHGTVFYTVGSDVVSILDIT